MLHCYRLLYFYISKTKYKNKHIFDRIRNVPLTIRNNFDKADY